MVAGCIMVCASVLPWLSDPLGEVYSAWRLPIDIGWPFHTSLFNYGLLCLCCAIYAFLVAYANWKAFKGSEYFVGKHTAAGILCVVPVALFLLQYLCSDVNGIAHLTQHMIQMLLIQRHLGYTAPAQLIVISPFVWDTSTLLGRLELLVDQVSIALVLPCLSAWMLIDHRRFFATSLRPALAKKRHDRVWLTMILIGIVLLVVVFGRAPIAMLCEDQARASLTAGDYEPALRWLDAARFLNPALDQMTYYHIEWGQAMYFLHPDQHSDDSRVYLAFTYNKQGDYLDAYQELLAAWHSQRTAPWVVDGMSSTLEGLAEFILPLKGPPIARSANDDTALPWLQLLTQVDPSNVYGQYLAGRIQYDLHNFTGCMAQMSMVIQLSNDSTVQSSAYTYMALSDAGQGDYIDERVLLLKAVKLDPVYLNNTAREELSGLR
jgi:hypothetical protein